jgi:hypothetical protein
VALMSARRAKRLAEIVKSAQEELLSDRKRIAKAMHRFESFINGIESGLKESEVSDSD